MPSTTQQIRSCLQQATTRLRDSSDSARLDAELLLAHCLGKSRSYLFTWPERELDTDRLDRFEHLLQQRLQGTPIAYLLGYREFWGLELQVSPDTLIPRPDTERLVELALERIPARQPMRILDLGTGSGAISIAIASERPLVSLCAVDLSPPALAIARQNALRHQLANVHCLLSNWFSAIPERPDFDLILSNPPYIPATDPHLQQGDVRFEPPSALISGMDGLDDIRSLVSQAGRYLRPQGWLMFEHGHDQGQAAAHLLTQAGFSQVSCHQDLAGHDRVSTGQWHHHP